MGRQLPRIARQYTRTTVLARSSERYCPTCKKVMTYRFDQLSQHSRCTGCGGYKAVQPSVVGNTDYQIVKIYDRDRAARLQAQAERQRKAELHECVCRRKFAQFSQLVDHLLTCKEWNAEGGTIPPAR